MTANTTVSSAFESNGLATTLSLPPRPPSPIRFLGYLLFAIALADIIASAFWIASSLHPAPAIPFPVEGAVPDPSFIRYLTAVLAIPCLLAALAIIYAGLRLLLPNSVRIKITDTDLLITTYAGPFPKTKSRPLSAISEIRITDVYPGLQYISSPGEPQRSSFIIECKNRPALFALPGYYKTTVLQTANLLADEFQRRRLPLNRPQSETPPDSLPDAPVSASARTPSAPPSQPPDSKITFLSAPDSLTFIIPRTGIKGAAVALLIFAVFWNAVAGSIALAFLAVFIHEPSLENFFPLPFLCLFVAVGIGVFLLFLQTAFRKAVIVATPASFILTQKAPIKDREYQWPVADIKSFQTDFSGTSVNNRRYRELRILFKASTHIGFFDGRDDAELEWLAATLQNFYNL